MYASTCADMQVDVMGECLSSIKHVVGREIANNQSVRQHLNAFTRGRIIGKLEEGRSVTSVAAEFGIAHIIVSRLWRQFQTTGTAIRGFSSGRPRGTTPADDRYIVLQARRNRRQTAGEIARHTTQATDDRYIAFYRGQKTALWWSVCTTPCTVPLTLCPSEKTFFIAGNTGIERQCLGTRYSLQI
ncbi:transposable element Tcb2 transposase [Trichonephila clavipes]|nr:transposable element Tcb2 transposase [Trichonephila clavipes]